MSSPVMIPSPSPSPPDPQLDAALRPRLLSDFTGQKSVVDNLKVAIDAAKARGEAMDHVMLYGAAGLGKTTIAGVCGNELGVRTVTTSGPNLRKGCGISNVLRNLEFCQILFIDEIHAMDRSIEEILYPALEDYRIDFSTGGGRMQVRSVRLEPFTLIAATTQPGKLTAALRDKFKIVLQLELYAVEDMVRIVGRSAGLLQLEMAEAAVLDIAKCARGVPRLANNLIRRVRDYAQLNSAGRVTAKTARAALDLYGIDHYGLDRLDRQIIHALTERFDGRPVGLQALAGVVNADIRTVENVSEPHLIRLGLVDRTARGRQATHLAFDYMSGKQPLPV